MAQATRVFNCADCDEPVETKYKTKKYCDLCRLFRDLTFLGLRKTKCLSCQEAFCPTNSNHKLCWECDFTAADKHPIGECRLCDASPRPLLSPDVLVCLQCTQDPAQREAFTRAVGYKRHAQIKANKQGVEA